MLLRIILTWLIIPQNAYPSARAWQWNTHWLCWTRFHALSTFICLATQFSDFFLIRSNICPNIACYNKYTCHMKRTLWLLANLFPNIWWNVLVVDYRTYFDTSITCTHIFFNNIKILTRLVIIFIPLLF